MAEFLGVVLASLIGALLAPSFSHLLNENKNKREKRLGYLEEAYILAIRIHKYTSQMPSHIGFFISTQTNNIEIKNIPKLPEEPFSRMDVLLDYYLKASDDLILKTKCLCDITHICYRPILEAINKTEKERGESYVRGLELAIKAAEEGEKVSNEIKNWIKTERSKLEPNTNSDLNVP